MKKKIIMAIMCIAAATNTFADDNRDHIGLGVGLLYENGLDVTLSYEHETRYHNAWEYYGNVYLKWKECDDCGQVCSDSFWKNYNTWELGVAYKPAVHIGRNNVGRLRFTGHAGSDTDDVVVGVGVGYEHSYVLKNKMQLFWQVKSDVMIQALDLFKTGITLGIKY